MIDQELRQRLAAGEEAVIDLVVQFGLGSLRDMVGQLLARRQEIDWPTWRAEKPGGLVQRWEAFCARSRCLRVAARIARSPEAAEVLDVIRRDVAFASAHAAAMRRAAGTLAVAGREQGDSGDPGGDSSKTPACRAAGRRRLGRAKRITTPSATPPQSSAMSIKAVKPLLAFDPAAALPAAETALRLTAVAEGVAGAYEGRKRELAAMDFNDLLILRRGLLCGPHGANCENDWPRKPGSSWSMNSKTPIRSRSSWSRPFSTGGTRTGSCSSSAISSSRSIAFAGPIPTSSSSFSREIPAAGQLPLSLNFRSQPAVLDFVNALFGGEFADYEPLRASREQVGPVPAVEFLWATAPEATPEEDAELGDESSEGKGEAARWPTTIPKPSASGGARPSGSRGGSALFSTRARRSSGIEGAARAVRPGDVALLFRAMTNVEYYEDALRRAGIDYCLVGGRAFYAQQEIFDVVNLLRALANPSDEVSLVGALSQPLLLPLGRDALLAQPASGRPGGRAVRRACRRRSWTPSRLGGRASPPKRSPRFAP